MIPYDAHELASLPLHSGGGSVVGTARAILEAKWDNREIPWEPGSHEVPIGTGLLVHYRGVTSIVDVLADVIVGREFFLGPIPVTVRGFHDEQKGHLVTRKLRTDMIDPHAIQGGKVAGWTKLENDQ